ncbi:MAG: hypothetical protein ABMA25_03490 [Ilumatobacteraceae bacterium]
MFGKQPEASVPGRAVIVPTGTRLPPHHTTSDFAANMHITANVQMKAISALDGMPVDERLMVLEWSIPSWMFYLFHDSGSNAPGADQLPAQVVVDVAISLATRQPVGIYVDHVETEYAAYRDAAVARWKFMDAPLATARQWMTAPKKFREGVKGIKEAWGEAKDGMRTRQPGTPPRQTVKDSDIEAIRRQANILSFHYERHRDDWQVARNSALMALPTQAQQVVAGILHPVDFEVLVMRAHVSKTISDEEAAYLRQQAGLT